MTTLNYLGAGMVVLLFLAALLVPLLEGGVPLKDILLAFCAGVGLVGYVALATMLILSGAP